MICLICAYSVLSKEYQDVLQSVSAVVQQHQKTLVPGMPQLNMCDLAVMVRAKLPKQMHHSVGAHPKSLSVQIRFYVDDG